MGRWEIVICVSVEEMLKVGQQTCSSGSISVGYFGWLSFSFLQEDVTLGLGRCGQKVMFRSQLNVTTMICDMHGGSAKEAETKGATTSLMATQERKVSSYLGRQ
jgi:hypothetical protein